MLNFVYRVVSYCRVMTCSFSRFMVRTSLIALVVACLVSPVAAALEPATEPSDSKVGQTNVASLPAFVETGRGLAGLAFSDDGSKLYVTSNAGNALIMIDVATQEIVQTVSGPQIGHPGDGCSHNFCRGAGAVGVAIGIDGRYAYVTSMKPDALAIVDLQEGRMVDAVPVEWFPQNIVLSPDGRRAYLINLVSNSVSVVDLDSRETVNGPIQLWGGSATRMPYGRPVGLALSADGSRLFVANGVRDTVDVFDTTTGKQAAAVMPATGPWDLAIDPRNGNLVVLLKGGIVTYNGKTLTPVRARAFCGGAGSYTLALSPDGRMLALSASRANKAVTVNRQTAAITGVYDTGDWPLALQFSPDGTLLAVLATGDNGGVNLYAVGGSGSDDADVRVFCSSAEFRAKNGVIKNMSLNEY